ncbi:hypothetical protein [Bergeyella zoohelcum]|uniref:hypothetical protein n=1 Tax=Bergeyella zoohelcum TaxID=1015 RepID=UPI0037350DB4
MKELGLSYKEIKKMPWAMLMRIIADLPRVEYLSEEESKKQEQKALTPQTAEDFKNYIKAISQNKKQ